MLYVGLVILTVQVIDKFDLFSQIGVFYAWFLWGLECPYASPWLQN